MIDMARFKVALDRVAMGLDSADRQMRPKTAEAGGKAMAYGLSTALGVIEMPEAGPMELVWDHWARRKDGGDARAMAMSVLIQLIPPPIREEDLPILGQIALWLDMAEYADDQTRDSDALAARVASPEMAMAESAASAAFDALSGARHSLRDCLMTGDDSAACDPQRTALAAAEARMDAAASLIADNL